MVRFRAMWPVVLAGCAQGIPRGVPERPSPAFAALSLSAGGSAKDVDTSQSMTLAVAFKLALARSEQIALAESNVREADIRRRERRGEIEPNASLTASGILQRERTAGDTVLVSGQQLVGEARVQQPLLRRGFFSSREAAERTMQSASASLERERDQLARDVAEVFVTVLRTRKLVDLARTAVTRAKTQHELALGRVKAGQALKNAELLAVIDLRRAELQEVNAQRDASTAEVAFQRLVGRTPPATLELPPTPPLPTTEQAMALAKKRTDLVALQHGVRAASADLEASEGRRWWPRLDVDASVQYLQPKIFNSNFNWQVVGLLTIPLWQSGREHTDIALRENATRIASLALEQQEKIVVEELERAAIQLASTAKAAELADKQREAAREHYKLVDKQVRLGAITFLEVTNAQAVLVEAENAFEAAAMDRVLAVYDYLFAIGAIDLSK